MIEVSESGNLIIVWGGRIAARLDDGVYTCYDKEAVVKSLRETAASLRRRAKTNKDLEEGRI